MGLEELVTACHQLGVHVVFKPFIYDGAYYHRYQLIVIDARLPIRMQRCILAHEYIHALHGHDGHQRTAIERRVTRDAARLLISPAEYRLTEQIYEGEVWQIAEELDVTVEFIHAYQEWLTELSESCS